MSLKFEASDFDLLHETRRFPLGESAAVIAQDIFDRWLESQIVVYGCIPPAEEMRFWNEKQISKDTHKARLVVIEPIEKVKCEHTQGINPVRQSVEGSFYCQTCAKFLKPTGWEQVDD